VRQTFGDDILRHQAVHLPADFLLRHLLERRQIDFLDQSPMQAHLGIEQLFTQQCVEGRGRGLDDGLDGLERHGARRALRFRPGERRRRDPASSKAT
jgi:hypothetical protein